MVRKIVLKHLSLKFKTICISDSKIDGDLLLENLGALFTICRISVFISKYRIICGNIAFEDNNKRNVVVFYQLRFTIVEHDWKCVKTYKVVSTHRETIVFDI